MAFVSPHVATFCWDLCIPPGAKLSPSTRNDFIGLRSCQTCLFLRHLAKPPSCPDQPRKQRIPSKRYRPGGTPHGEAMSQAQTRKSTPRHLVKGQRGMWQPSHLRIGTTETPPQQVFVCHFCCISCMAAICNFAGDFPRDLASK